MSLINKMLQDLEGRRLEGEAVGALDGQIRAVPEAPRVHVAWWIVFALSLILTGVISWLWGYRAAPAVVPGESMPQLSSTLASDDRVLHGLEPAAAAAENSASDSLIVAPSASESEPHDAGSALDVAAVDQNQYTTTAPESLHKANPVPNAEEKPVGSAVVSPVPRIISAPVSTVPRIAGTEAPAERATPEKADAIERGRAADRPLAKRGNEAEFDIPAHVTKEVKELTSHQRAEEEFRRAAALLNQGRATESMTALENALRIEPRHTVARQTLAGLLLEAKRPEEAIRKLQHGLTLEKEQPALAMMLARLQVEKGELGPAVETLRRTLPYAAERADYQAFLAALLQREGRHKEAVEFYVQALRKSPQNGLWWMGIAISLQADSRLEEARDAFGRAKVSGNLSPELIAFVDEKLQQLR